jgi:predicted MPP superfamily phosphohydrolase
VPEGEHAFTFTVISDTQNRGNAAHRPLIEQIRASQPDLLFNVGDLVADGRNLGDWEEFFRVEGELLRNVPLYAVLGNHDRAAALYFQFFVLPGNERYYSFNRGTTHFVVLDSPGPYAPEDNQAITPAARARFQEQREQYWREQIQWLQDDLAGHPDAKYMFVFLHTPRSRRFFRVTIITTIMPWLEGFTLWTAARRAGRRAQ